MTSRCLRQRLRDMRNKERTLARAKRREARGKGSPRGESFPGIAEHPLQRKQVFAAALKRVNREIDRMQKLEARTTHIEAATRPCHAPGGSVSAAVPGRGRTNRRHARAAQATAAYKRSPCKDWEHLASD